MVEVRSLLILYQTNLTQTKETKWTRKFNPKTETAMMPTTTTMVDNSNGRQLLAGVKFDLNNLRTMQLRC
jgi:hypothetical protein